MDGCDLHSDATSHPGNSYEMRVRKSMVPSLPHHEYARHIDSKPVVDEPAPFCVSHGPIPCCRRIVLCSSMPALARQLGLCVCPPAQQPPTPTNIQALGVLRLQANRAVGFAWHLRNLGFPPCAPTLQAHKALRTCQPSRRGMGGSVAARLRLVCLGVSAASHTGDLGRRGLRPCFWTPSVKRRRGPAEGARVQDPIRAALGGARSPRVPATNWSFTSLPFWAGSALHVSTHFSAHQLLARPGVRRLALVQGSGRDIRAGQTRDVHAGGRSHDKSPVLPPACGLPADCLFTYSVPLASTTLLDPRSPTVPHRDSPWPAPPPTSALAVRRRRCCTRLNSLSDNSV